MMEDAKPTRRIKVNPALSTLVALRAHLAASPHMLDIHGLKQAIAMVEKAIKEASE